MSRKREGLPREEWDFSGCPEGREADCCAYEYGRELEWLVSAYADARRKAERGLGGALGFDADGVWHMTGDGPRCRMELQLPAGFPDKPYLLTSMHTPVVPRRPHIYEIWNPPFGEYEELRGIFGDKVRGFKLKWQRVSVNWDFSDKRIVRDFVAWLKRTRSKPARLGSGRSRTRRQLKELKALGAYRLMKTMTAEEALAYTKRFLPYGLYTKVPDWYEARALVKDLLGWMQCTIVGVRSFHDGRGRQRGGGRAS